MRHLLSAADLDLGQIGAILDLAEEMAQVLTGRSRSCRRCVDVRR